MFLEIFSSYEHGIIIRKIGNNSSRLCSRTCFCCHYGIIENKDLLLNHKSFFWQPSNFLGTIFISIRVKDTQMQIWKSLYMVVFIFKQYPENFAFLILRILELFTREVCKFLKKWAHFYYILLFLNICKQTFQISHVRISQKLKSCFNVKSWAYYFHMKTKILENFQICISVLLKETWKCQRAINPGHLISEWR